jgi:hypothetical protein
MDAKQGKSNKRRGGDAERRLAKLIHDLWGYNVRRGFVWLRQPDLVGLIGIHIECKYCAREQMGQWMRQAIEASQRFDDGIPVVISGVSRKPWLATLRYRDWLRMGGEETEKDNRKALNIRNALLDEVRVRYIKSEIDLVTMYLDEFMDTYGAWKLPFA